VHNWDVAVEAAGRVTTAGRMHRRPCVANSLDAAPEVRALSIALVLAACGLLHLRIFGSA